MIPIKIETLLEGRRVEQNRIEYKEGFNPSEIVHTICGYANDIAGDILRILLGKVTVL